MYALMIKDRGFPVHLYLQHMMKVINVSRTKAAIQLGDFAYNAGLKETAKTPLNNTMSDWLRNPQKTPQWAVVSSMRILDCLGRIPQTEQEWAFWALAHLESSSNMSSNLPAANVKMWLDRARNYSFWYSQRSVIKHTVKECTNSLLAAKVIYTLLGECSHSASFPDVFFTIDESLLGQEQIASSIRNEVELSKYQVEHVRLNDKKAHQTYKDIKHTVKELSSIGILSVNENGLMKINAQFITNFSLDQN